jgi:hypothetical protein
MAIPAVFGGRIRERQTWRDVSSISRKEVQMATYGLGFETNLFQLYLGGNIGDRFSFLDKLTGGTELVSITADGHVGIGTSQPKTLLSLGPAVADTKLALQEDSSVYGLGFGKNQFRLHLGGQPGDRFSFLDSSGGNELVRFGTSRADFWGDVSAAGNLGVTGDVTVQGTVTANALDITHAKKFKIDHPLDPDNKWLFHSSVESSDMKNMYDGVVTLDAEGRAMVELPAWFNALNERFCYQLTALGEPMPALHVAREISDNLQNQFTIAGGVPEGMVSWQVTGVRHDECAKHRPMVVEQDKLPDERGKRLVPPGRS